MRSDHDLPDRIGGVADLFRLGTGGADIGQVIVGVVGEAGGGGAAGLRVGDGLLQRPVAPDEGVGDGRAGGLALGVGRAAALRDYRAIGISAAIDPVIVSGGRGPGGAGLVDEVHAESGCAGAKGYKRLRLDESGATVRGDPNFTNFVHVARGK